MLVVDIMHEFELGVWKALFTHAIRILYAGAPGGRLVSLLDERYGDSLCHASLHPYDCLQQDTSTDIAKHPRSLRLSESLQTTFRK